MKNLFNQISESEKERILNLHGFKKNKIFNLVEQQNQPENPKIDNISKNILNVLTKQNTGRSTEELSKIWNDLQKTSQQKTDQQSKSGQTEKPTQPVRPKYNIKDVIDIQTKLKGLGFDLGNTGKNKDGVDGDLGMKTLTAIKGLLDKNIQNKQTEVTQNSQVQPIGSTQTSGTNQTQNTNNLMDRAKSMMSGYPGNTSTTQQPTFKVK